MIFPILANQCNFLLMPVMKTGGREIQLEKVDGRFVKLSIPEEVLEAVNTMPLENRATLLIKAAAQYRLSPEQFEFVMSSAKAIH